MPDTKDIISGALEAQTGLMNKKFDELTEEMGAIRNLAKKAGARAASSDHTLDGTRAHHVNSSGMRMIGEGPGAAMVPDSEAEEITACRIMHVKAEALRRGKNVDPLDVAEEWEDGFIVRNMKANKELVAAARSGDAMAKKTFGAHMRCDISDFLPVTSSPDYVPTLRSNSCVRNMNPVVMPLVGREMTLPFMKEFASAEYAKECSAPNPIELNSGSIKVKKRKLMISAYMCDEFLEDSSYNVAGIIRQELQASLTEKEDRTFLRSKGDNGAPFGMGWWSDNANNSLVAQSVAGLPPSEKLARIFEDLYKMMACVLCNNANASRVGWILSCRTQFALMACVDGNGNRPFFDEMRTGTLLGRPFCTTTQIPDNIDFFENGLDNSSEIYLADFSAIHIFQSGTYSFDVLRTSFNDLKGKTRHGALEDITVFKSVGYHDFVEANRGKTTCVMRGVTWGAL